MVSSEELSLRSSSRNRGASALRAAARGEITMDHTATFICPCSPRRRRKRRRGAIVVELALVLPLIVFLVVATIDATTMVFLNHSLTIAAYEGIRVAVRPNGTDADALAHANDVLTERSVNGSSVSVSPSNVEDLSSGTPITVTASAACDSNVLLPSLFYSGKTLTATCTMVKE
jgi:Flp pilus assembly protein TadG